LTPLRSSSSSSRRRGHALWSEVFWEPICWSVGCPFARGCGRRAGELRHRRESSGYIEGKILSLSAHFAARRPAAHTGRRPVAQWPRHAGTCPPHPLTIFHFLCDTLSLLAPRYSTWLSWSYARHSLKRAGPVSRFGCARSFDMTCIAPRAVGTPRASTFGVLKDGLRTHLSFTSSLFIQRHQLIHSSSRAIIITHLLESSNSSSWPHPPTFRTKRAQPPRLSR